MTDQESYSKNIIGDAGMGIALLGATFLSLGQGTLWVHSGDVSYEHASAMHHLSELAAQAAIFGSVLTLVGVFFGLMKSWVRS